MTTDTRDDSTNKGDKRFVTALMLASFLGASTVVLCGNSLAQQIAAGALAAGIWIFGGEIILGRRPRRFFLVILLSMVLMAIFFAHVIGGSSQFPLRLLQIASALCYGAVVLAASVRMLHLAGDDTALIVSFSLAASLFLGEVIIPRMGVDFVNIRWMQVQGVPRWIGGTTPHPVLGSYYVPHSSAKTYYPDNPRGYFEEMNPIQDSWSVETHEDSEAQLERSAEQPELMRMNILKVVGKVPWHLRLQQRYLQLRGGERYFLSFRARADRSRLMVVATSQDHAPWRALGLYHEFRIQPQWDLFENTFVATETDPNARLHFDVGTSDAAVEIADVMLTRGSQRISVTPNLPHEYSVTYNFNSLGCRGHDYDIPRPAGTFRILALGDSFTLGVGVHERDTLTAWLERLLNDGSNLIPKGFNYEVINCGVSGYAAREERLSYETTYAKYSPQVVLLVMACNEDLLWQSGMKRDDSAVIDKYERFSALWLFFQALRDRRSPADLSKNINELITLNNLCRHRDAKFGVVVFRSARYKMYDQLLNAVTEGTKGTGIPVLDLGPALLNGRSEKDLMVHEYDAHPNEIAHAIAADEILRFLIAQNLLSIS